MAIRSKRSSGTPARAAKAKSKASTAGRKKAGVRKQAAGQKKSATQKKKKKATRKKRAASATKKQSATRKSTAKRASRVARPTGTAAKRPAAAKPRTARARASHPATIARLYPERIGTVLHYYAQARGAIVQLERGEVHLGDAVHIRGHTTDFYDRIEELKIDDRPVEVARCGQTVGIRVSRTVRENDGFFLLSE